MNQQILKKVRFGLLISGVIIFAFLFLGPSTAEPKVEWGMNFSQKYCQELGLQWKEVYLGILDDLGAKNMKLAGHWDILHPTSTEMYFGDLRWQLDELEKRNGKAIVVLGLKSTRWPECH